MKLKVTQNQEAALDLGNPDLLAEYGIKCVGNMTYEGSRQAWDHLRDAAEHFARDWSSETWNDPYSTGARTLARKIKKALTETPDNA